MNDGSRARLLLAQLARPIFGYAGIVDERIDFETVSRLADGGANVVLVGPIERIDPSVLPRRPDVHFTGAADASEVEAFAAGFDRTLEF